jgi:hypothetical protein
MKIALLVPLCSRNQIYKGLQETPFFHTFLPNFLKTKEDGYVYKIFVGFDDDDVFYQNHFQDLQNIKEVDVTILSNCQHHPVRAWNYLFEKAINQGFDYYFQIGDDVGLLTHGWTTRFSQYLQNHDNIGTVGPCEPMNYFGRKQLGKKIVNETNFVHKTHYDIFGYFFYPEIRNWYCDDWITFVYDEKYAHMDLFVLCTNDIKGDRYQITECPQLMKFIHDGKIKLKDFLKERCLRSSNET